MPPGALGRVESRIGEAPKIVLGFSGAETGQGGGSTGTFSVMSKRLAVNNRSGPEHYNYSEPQRVCDVVMKGGITSGVVYPHAVCELARTYRFKNVGGTSAGAIAAAATAAAEYGRANGSFNELAKLPDWIGSEGNLRKLFQPEESTKGLYLLLIAAVAEKKVKPILAALRHYLLTIVFGLLPAIVLIVLALREGPGLFDNSIFDWSGFEWALVIAAIVLAMTGALVLFAVRVVRSAVRAVPDNDYGICSGSAPPTEGKPLPLTSWLNERINSYSGLGEAQTLTFGHLWGGPGKDLPKERDKRYIQLEMMTTNLTNQRAHRLPWDETEWFFDPVRFRKLFPEEVVAWMESHPPPEPTQPTKKQDWRLLSALLQPLRPFPSAENLPVIVATRMSLSFPVLLSAISLFRMDMSREANQESLQKWRSWARQQGKDWNPLATRREEWPDRQPQSVPGAERCWFSDGGISSNFPLHFFDQPIPRWPTFAINLRPFHPDHPKSETNQMENTWMVDSNRGGWLDWWYRAPKRRFLWWKDGRLLFFVSRIMRTMQNRVDEAQMRVPGYRDRIVHVSMTKEEGGMNLDMPSGRISVLAERGRCAAARLIDAYIRPAASATISWDNHRWVRLRSTLAVLEQMEGDFANGYQSPVTAPNESSYAVLINRSKDEPPSSYRFESEAERKLAEDQVKAITGAAALTKSSGETLTECAPEPAPVGRIVPRD